jgi:hypothetical protein
MFPANARALLLPPSGTGVLLGDGTFSFRIVGRARHRAALDKLSAGRKLRCAALLTHNGRDYDPDGIMVTIKGKEIGFLLWIHGHDFCTSLRQAGFVEAACKAEITGDHEISDQWDFVGATIDASLPFDFISHEELRMCHARGDKSPTPRSHSVKGKTLTTVLKRFKQSILKPASLRGANKSLF